MNAPARHDTPPSITRHPAFARSTSEAVGLADLIRQDRLVPHYQPVADIVRQRVYGYESLIRGPADTPLQYPDALFHDARHLGLSMELEYACVRSAVKHYEPARPPLREPTLPDTLLFINISAAALLDHWHQWKDAQPERLFGSDTVPLTRIVLELTETDPVTASLPTLTHVFSALRARGLRIALDDYGSGHSSLQVWLEVRPEIVKIDRYFFRDICRDERRQRIVRAIQSVAQSQGSLLLAEGIETAEDLLCVRDMGIRLAQGWFLGMPQAHCAPDLPSEAMSLLALHDKDLPEDIEGTAANLRIAAPVLRASNTNDEVHRLFVQHPRQHAVAIVDADGCPVGIINRRDFSERYAQQYTRELFGRNPCSTFMNTAPVLVERSMSIDQLSHVLTSDDQRYLLDGFVITRNGRYDALGTGEALVRSVTEIRIAAARYANPLTSLPGNIPISQHISDLLKTKKTFVTCYCDLNNFKPFNDVYGYWRGDDMILLCAEVIRENCEPRHDFVGHVGGDDFVILFCSSDWQARATRIVAAFKERAVALYDELARVKGGIEAEDRYGVMRFFPLITLGIGALVVQPDANTALRPQDVASAAASVKHKVKHGNLSLVIEDFPAA